MPVQSAALSTALNTDERTSPPVQEVQRSMQIADDAVDVQLQDHTKEVDQDTITNPVEQNRKRVQRSNEAKFLEDDSSAQP